MKKIIVLVIVFVVFYIWFINYPNKTTKNNSETIKCNRSEPYKLAPEFERARSLRMQRLEEKGEKMDRSWYNCINIKYAEGGLNSDKEGFFYFDKKSKLNDLTIYVNPSYKVKNDILTALLISHEMVHVGQFIKEVNGGEPLSCIDKEVKANFGQIQFFWALNQDELNLIAGTGKMYDSGELSKDDNYYIYQKIGAFLTMKNTVQNYCNEKYQPEKNGFTQYDECAFQQMQMEIKNYLINQGNYEEQCNL